MKKRLFIFFIGSILFLFSGNKISEAKSVTINEKNFPDMYFRYYVELRFDQDEDGVLSDAERDAVTKLDIGQGSDYKLDLEYPVPETLQGIEYFTKLRELNCSECDLWELDVSKNKELIELHCNNNWLEKLNLKKNKKLQVLICYNNVLKKLDFSKNTSLKELYCSDNKLSDVDLHNNAKMTELDISNNKIKEIKVDNLKELKKLSCKGNKLKKLNVSKNSRLIGLVCDKNKIKSLNVKKNIQLGYLYCSDNQISKLDLRNNKLLTWLTCHNNRILTGNLKITRFQLERCKVSGQKCTIKRKKIGKYYYVPLKGINSTNEIKNVSHGVVTEKGIRLKKGKLPKKITYEYNMFTDGEEMTKVTIQVKK